MHYGYISPFTSSLACEKKKKTITINWSFMAWTLAYYYAIMS